MGEDCQQFTLCQATAVASLAELWRAQQLIDVHIQSADGALLGAHRIVLAASSGFFRALFCGAGQAMREGTTVNSASSLVVELPYNQQQVSALLEILYEHNIRVGCRAVHSRAC